MCAHPGAAAAPRAAADLRLLRAAVFAAVCVALAATGHGYASGETVPLWALGAGWLCVLAVAARLAGRERSLPGIATLLLSGQLALHTLFTIGQGHLAGIGGHRAGGAQLGLLAGRLLCGPHAGHGSPEQVVRHGLDPHIHPHIHAGGPSPAPPASLCDALASVLPMLLGHIAAAVVAGWVLRRGEAALWRLVRISARLAETSALRLRTALALVRAALNGRMDAQAAPQGAPARDDGTRPPDPALLQHCVVRRGPPAFALAA